jgi:hypothetical protein
VGIVGIVAGALSLSLGAFDLLVALSGHLA